MKALTIQSLERQLAEKDDELLAFKEKQDAKLEKSKQRHVASLDKLNAVVMK